MASSTSTRTSGNDGAVAVAAPSEIYIHHGEVHCHLHSDLQLSTRQEKSWTKTGEWVKVRISCSACDTELNETDRSNGAVEAGIDWVHLGGDCSLRERSEAMVGSDMSTDILEDSTSPPPIPTRECLSDGDFSSSPTLRHSSTSKWVSCSTA